MVAMPSPPTEAPRPDYMVHLGLLPPYTAEDVRRAYNERVKLVHPDRGGTPEAFHALENAYQRAMEHVEIRADRRQWIAAHVDEYMEHRAGFVALTKLGAEVEVSDVDWVKRSFGEFAALTEYIVAVRVPGRTNAAEIVGRLVENHQALGRLKTLDLAGCPINDDDVFELRVLRSLAVLNLAGTNITRRALGIVHWLPALQLLDATGTRAGWWPRWKADRFLRRRVKQAGAIDAAVHPVNAR